MPIHWYNEHETIIALERIKYWACSDSSRNKISYQKIASRFIFIFVLVEKNIKIFNKRLQKYKKFKPVSTFGAIDPHSYIYLFIFFIYLFLHVYLNLSMYHRYLVDPVANKSRTCLVTVFIILSKKHFYVFELFVAYSLSSPLLHENKFPASWPSFPFGSVDALREGFCADVFLIR